MSLGNCIPGLVEAGKLTKKQGKRAQEAYDRHYARLARDMSPVAAAAEASEAALRELEFEAKQKKRQAFLQAESQKNALGDMDRYRGKSPYAAVRAMIARDINGPFDNVEASAQRIEFQAQSRLAGFIEHFRRDLTGRSRDKTGMRDVVAELHGEASGNAQAKNFAAALGSTFEYLRLRFNAAGGTIGKLKNWGLPHNWDALKVRGASYADWRADMLAELDLGQMVDNKTGGPFTPETIETALQEVYESIRTNGLNAEPGSGFGSKLANRRSDHRFFKFKTAEGWMRIHAKYGTGDPFTIIMNHVRGMSTDIAMMERFGPSPDATVRYLIDQADRQEARSDGAAVGPITNTSGGRRKTEKLWSYMKGDLNAPVFPEGGLEKVGMAGVKILAGTRDLLAASMLGSAPLTAISDLNTQALTRRFNALPQSSLILGYVRELASRKEHDLSARLGLGMRDASRAMLGLSRYFGETNGPTLTAVIADDVLRLSGLNKFTEAGQHLFGKDFLRELAADRGKSFAELAPGRQAAMERYGIGAEQWNRIREAEAYEQDGAHYLDWQAIGDRTASDRMMNMVLGETNAAVQEAGAAARAMLVTDRPGTFWGEFGRNVVQFKSFGLSLMLNQAQRIAALPPGRRYAYAAQFLIGMTLFGALSIQLREVAKGRDPRPMENGEFWLDALVQGGGLGIFGDLFGSFNNDRIGSVGAFIAGPVGSLAEDVKDTIIADWKADDDHEHKGRHAVRLAKRYTPGGNLWYARLAFERELLDRLSAEIDPDYYESWERMERTAADQGQALWWRPGETAPERAPDAASAMQAAPQN
jgi:hypothetical protein